MSKPPVNRKRHEAQCSICKHPRREEIEHEWCSWASTARLAAKYKISKDAIYRHAGALGLFERRSRNLKAALEKIIEQAESVDVNASAVVSAIQAYAKINSQGAWVDRVEQVNLNDLFAKMTAAELETYAQQGILPDWFADIVGAKQTNDNEEDQNA
jgi:murein L,D-transpeptidase YcbB/YkuD